MNDRLKAELGNNFYPKGTQRFYVCLSLLPRPPRVLPLTRQQGPAGPDARPCRPSDAPQGLEGHHGPLPKVCIVSPHRLPSALQARQTDRQTCTNCHPTAKRSPPGSVIPSCPSRAATWCPPRPPFACALAQSPSPCIAYGLLHPPPPTAPCPFALHLVPCRSDSHVAQDNLPYQPRVETDNPLFTPVVGCLIAGTRCTAKNGVISPPLHLHV